MITEADYKKAQPIIDEYNKQLDISDVITINTNKITTNKDIEELLRNGGKLIALTKYREDKEVELMFYL